jgi:hypothetical protein
MLFTQSSNASNPNPDQTDHMTSDTHDPPFLNVFSEDMGNQETLLKSGTTTYISQGANSQVSIHPNLSQDAASIFANPPAAGDDTSTYAKSLVVSLWPDGLSGSAVLIDKLPSCIETRVDGSCYIRYP